jgi:hypothetical protein
MKAFQYTTGNGAAAPFLLVLADTDDLTALQVVQRLRSRDVPVRHVTPPEILMSPDVSHDPFGTNTVTLATGITISDDAILAIFNRVRHVNPLHFAGAAMADQIYATEEGFAFFISWLSQFGTKVCNPPHPGNLGGYRALSEIEDWLALAGSEDDFAVSSRARHLGLSRNITSFPEGTGPVLPSDPGMIAEAGTSGSVLICGEHPVQDGIPQDILGRIMKLLRDRNLQIARVSYLRTSDGIRLKQIDPFPQAETTEELEAITDHLRALASAAEVVA